MVHPYQMKSRILFWLCALSACAAGCGDGSNGESRSDGAYSVQASLNSERMTFDREVTGSIFDETYQNHFSASATLREASAASPNFPNVSFEINLPQPEQIAVGIYAQREVEMIFRYSLSGTRTYHSLAGESDDFEIELTEISSTSIKGRFTGTLFDANDPRDVVVVEDGEFVVPRD